MKKVFCLIFATFFMCTFCSCGISSTESIESIEGNLNIPLSLSYEEYVADFENYFIYENDLYLFENDSVKKVTELKGLGNQTATVDFVVRDNHIYYAAELNKETKEGKIYKKNLLDNTDDVVFEGYVFFIKSNGNDIYFNGYNSANSDYELGTIDSNDNVSFSQSLTISNDSTNVMVFVNDNKYFLLDGGIKKDNFINGKYFSLPNSAILSANNELYAVQSVPQNKTAFYVVDENLNKAVKIAECGEQINGVRYDITSFAIGDKKVIYLTENGNLYITNGTTTEKLLSDLPQGIVSWRIIDNTFYWFVSNESYGTIKLNSAK